jgi:uncharacterized protein (TIGR03086 family)
MDELAALRLATDEFARRLAQVPPDGWDVPTPCPDWPVLDLCDHLVGGNRFTVLLLGGTAWTTALREVRDGDFTGDPVDRFQRSGEQQLAAFAAGDALARTVGHPAGPMTGREFAGRRILDLVVHAWDVARAVGGDERLDQDLAEIALGVLEGDADAAAPGGAFGAGPSGTVGDRSPAHLRLLDMSGRRP